MLMWLYDIWEERQNKITPTVKLELEIIELKTLIDEKNKQIKNIYKILEVLTNESKQKHLNLNNSNK